ncbi:MAG: hypothetical protein QGG25_04460, partial [Phycisphaerae bacterium]|nr:hypothetical protein [Phycisphaerae bacterium]
LTYVFYYRHFRTVVQPDIINFVRHGHACIRKQAIRFWLDRLLRVPGAWLLLARGRPLHSFEFESFPGLLSSWRQHL